MDAFTFNLLANDEVIAVDQDAKGEAARRLPGENEVWAKTMQDGSLVVGLFNRGDTEKVVSVNWTALGLTGKCPVRDLWRQKDIGQFTDKFISTVRPHSVVLIRIIK